MELLGGLSYDGRSRTRRRIGEGPACTTMLLSTVCRSRVELTARPTSERRAVSRRSASVSSCGALGDQCAPGSAYDSSSRGWPRPVELVPERLQLVAGPDLDAMAEVAGADSRRAFLQRPDRRDHSPGEENARQHRQPEAEHEDDGAPDDRRPEGA